MDGEHKKGGMNMCGCGGIGYGHYGYKIAKKVLYLVVLIAVFCFGVQLGELKTLASIFRAPSHMTEMGGGMMHRDMGTSTGGWQ